MKQIRGLSGDLKPVQKEIPKFDQDDPNHRQQYIYCAFDIFQKGVFCLAL